MYFEFVIQGLIYKKQTKKLLPVFIRLSLCDHLKRCDLNS